MIDAAQPALPQVPDSIPSAAPSDVNAAVSAHPAPGETAATNLYNCPKCGERCTCWRIDPGPSLATGMSSDSANVGGDHEEVVGLSENTDIDKKAATAFEPTSLIARVAIDERKRTGTAPGASGPERDIFGAPNSESGACEGNGSNADGSKTADGRARHLSCGEAGGDASKQPSMASRLTPPRPQYSNSVPTPPPQATSETSVNCAGASASALSSSRIPGDWDRQAAAEASTPDLELSAAVDPGPCGFDFEAEISMLEAQWARDGITMNARTFATSVISDNNSKSTAVGD